MAPSGSTAHYHKHTRARTHTHTHTEAMGWGTVSDCLLPSDLTETKKKKLIQNIIITQTYYAYVLIAINHK